MGNNNNKPCKYGIKYHTISYSLKSLDLIFFKGDHFTSNMISFLQKKAFMDATKDNLKDVISFKRIEDIYSHVGVIIRPCEVLDITTINNLNLNPDKLYVWESTLNISSKVKNVQGKNFFGVQLRDLEKVIEENDHHKNTRVAIAPIKKDKREKIKFDDAFKFKFTNFFNTHNNTIYDANPVSLCSSVNTCCRPYRENFENIFNTDDYLFCSELVAKLFISLNLYSKNINEKDVVPIDLLGYDVDDNAIPCIVTEPYTIKYY